MKEEGYVKFDCDWVETEPLAEGIIREINDWRNRLYRLGLIGAYENGVGFGNISARLPKSDKFIISGTATGNIAFLTARHYTVVEEFDFEKNWLKCRGPIKASSESMTHAAVYLSDGSAKAAIHVHNLDFWKRLLGKVPTTSEKAQYGTPEMAAEIMRLFKETDVKEKKILAMAGHEEGIMSFGKTLDEAGKILLKRFQEAKA